MKSGRIDAGMGGFSAELEILADSRHYNRGKVLLKLIACSNHNGKHKHNKTKGAAIKSKGCATQSNSPQTVQLCECGVNEAIPELRTSVALLLGGNFADRAGQRYSYKEDRDTVCHDFVVLLTDSLPRVRKMM